MIIVLSKSAQSAIAIAEQLRGAIAKGPFVFYRSRDIRAARLAMRLAKEKAISINALLKWSSLLCLSVGCALAFTVKDKAVLTQTQLSVKQTSASVYYSGVALGFSLIALDGYKTTRRLRGTKEP